MKRKIRFGERLLWSLIPFATVCLIVTVSLAIYVAVEEKWGDKPAVVSVVMLLTIVLFSLLFTLGDVLRRKLTSERSVHAILEATERIAAGDFSARLDIRHAYEKYDDYDLIMENINAMAAALEKNEALNADFISNVSHEIKTPLALIRNHVEWLRSEKDGEKREKYTQIIVQATGRLSGLVTNVLKLNKLENQQLGFEREKIRLHEMLAEAALAFEDRYEEKQITLDCDLDEVEIYSSAGYLEIVWQNLISNAVKFTERGGNIRISLKKEGKFAVVRISDDGCGISAADGARIFDKFYQGETSHAGEGNGLGLALVKKVIDLVGGEISVVSEPGKGSTFTVRVRESEE